MSSGCLRRGFTFAQDRNKVTFTSNPAGSSNCGRSPSAAEEAAFAALGDANLAVFGADGTATIRVIATDKAGGRNTTKATVRVR